jgi:predicted ribosomally synthesized peptide with nif11-like leader
MSEDQLSALLAKLKEDEGLREKLMGAADLEDAIAIAKEAGLELTFKSDEMSNLEDHELELVAGGSAGRLVKSLIVSIFKSELNCNQEC